MNLKLRLLGIVSAFAFATTAVAQIVHYGESAKLDPVTIARQLGAKVPGKPKFRGIRLLDSEDSTAPAAQAPVHLAAAPASPSVDAYARYTPAPTANVAPAAQNEPAPAATEATGFSLPIGFAFDSARLMGESLEHLTIVADGLRLLGPDARILVEGHTDSIGNARYNLELSRRRALTVKSYLVMVHGIPERMLLAVGSGSEVPRNPANPAAAENRRVEFKRI